MAIMNNKYESRSLNIELLRIISMLLVMVIHYNVPINGQPHHNMVMDEPMKALGISLLKSISFICVNLFVLISGYFGIRWKWKGLSNYLFQIFFWAIAVYFICVAFQIHSFRLSSFIHQIVFCLGFNWFFTVYLGLYMMAPILNSFIDNNDDKRIGQVLVAFYLFQTVFGYILKNRYEFNQGLTIMSFVGLYIIGGYLRKTTCSLFQLSAKDNMKIYIFLTIALAVVSVIANYLNFSKDVFSYINPIAILQTIFLFLCFAKMTILRGKKIILFYSSSAFAGLLSHSFSGALLYGIMLEWIDKSLPFPFIWTIAAILLWFSIAVLIDKSRMWCYNRSFGKWL